MINNLALSLTIFEIRPHRPIAWNILLKITPKPLQCQASATIGVSWFILFTADANFMPRSSTINWKHKFMTRQSFGIYLFNCVGQPSASWPGEGAIPPKFWLVIKLSENSFCRKIFVQKRNIWGRKHPILEKIYRQKLKILSTHNFRCQKFATVNWNFLRNLAMLVGKLQLPAPPSF